MKNGWDIITGSLLDRINPLKRGRGKSFLELQNPDGVDKENLKTLENLKILKTDISERLSGQTKDFENGISYLCFSNIQDNRISFRSLLAVF